MQQNSQEQVEYNIVTNHDQRHEVKRRPPGSLVHSQVHYFIPVFTCQNLENGSHAPPNIVEIRTRRATVIVFESLTEELHAHEGVDEHTEKTEQSKIGYGVQTFNHDFKKLA